MENETDAEGRPICPVCGLVIRPDQDIGKSNDYVVHVECYPEARRRSEERDETG
jgi:hypothetical protein